MIEDLHVGFDLLLASAVSALLLRFVTRTRFQASLRALQANHARFARGLLLFVPGLLLQIPGTIWIELRPHPILSWITAASYPFFVLGAYRMYAAAHPANIATAQEAPAADAGVDA